MTDSLKLRTSMGYLQFRAGHAHFVRPQDRKNRFSPRERRQHSVAMDSVLDYSI